MVLPSNVSDYFTKNLLNKPTICVCPTYFSTDILAPLRKRVLFSLCTKFKIVYFLHCCFWSYTNTFLLSKVLSFFPVRALLFSDVFSSIGSRDIVLLWEYDPYSNSDGIDKLYLDVILQ